MKESQIDNQVQITYKENKRNDSECTICMVDFESNEQLKMLSCGHYFHEHCIRDWLQIKAVCPKCNLLL